MLVKMVRSSEQLYWKDLHTKIKLSESMTSFY